MKKIFPVFLIIFSVWVSECFARGMPVEPRYVRPGVSSDLVEAQLRVHVRCNIGFSVTNWGFLGSEGWNLYESPGCLFCDDPGGSPFAPSFEFPSNSGLEHLHQGALWIGAVTEEETLVSVGAAGWWWIYEWAPASDIVEKEWLADQECLAVFTDTIVPPPLTETPESTDWDEREHRPLYVQVSQTSHSWQTPPFDDFVILDYSVKNIGDRLISQTYLGFYADPDVMGFPWPY